MTDLIKVFIVLAVLALVAMSRSVVVVVPIPDDTADYLEIGRKLRVRYAMTDMVKVISTDCIKTFEHNKELMKGLLANAGSQEQVDMRILKEAANDQYPCVQLEFDLAFQIKKELEESSFTVIYASDDTFAAYLSKLSYNVKQDLQGLLIELNTESDKAQIVTLSLINQEYYQKIEYSEFISKTLLKEPSEVKTDDDTKFYVRLYLSIGVVAVLMTVEGIFACRDVRKALRNSRAAPVNVYHRMGETPV